MSSAAGRQPPRAAPWLAGCAGQRASRLPPALQRSVLEGGSLRDHLQAIIARLQHCGHDVIGVEMTAPELSKRHLRVVRAIVPGLQPLGLEGGGRFGGSRLYQAPQRMGHRRDVCTEADLNPIPHCFP